VSAITVHPEFDPVTMSWFWDEYEAPTLRELQALLGPQVVIADYYPRGVDRRIKEVFLTIEERLAHLSKLKRTGRIEFGEYVRRTAVVQRAAKAQKKVPSFGSDVPSMRTIKRPPVALARVLAGMTPEPVYRERKKPGPTGTQPHLWDRNARILELWSQKYTVKQIIRMLDLTLAERSIWSLLKRARARGEPAAKSHRNYRRALPDNPATRRALSQQRSENDVHQAS
jgi:hypothetical protein